MALHVMDEANHCLGCKVPRCQQGCPIHTNIPEVIRLLKANKLDEAGRMLFENNPLTTVCSLVCNHENQCEGHCVRGIKGAPVHFSVIENYISSTYASQMTQGPAPSNGKKAAIIGSGPAGLTIAVILARYGYDVTIFESHDKIGGVLRYGIPEFRLPKTVLDDFEYRHLRLKGIKVRPNTDVGKALKIEDLFRDGYKAIFIGTGVWRPNTLHIKGESLGNVHYAINYLQNPDVYHLGNRVIVIGAGNAAMDVARTAIRHGTRHLECFSLSSHITASEYEASYAKLEGVNFIFNKKPLEITDKGVVFIDLNEAECGFPLFTRTKSGVTLTAAAEKLMPAIQQMLASSESLDQSIAQINGMHKGALRLGVFNSACVTWLPKIVPGFRAAFPGIDVQIYQGSYDDITGWLKTGAVELGFLSNSSAHDLDFEPLYDDRLICIAPPGYQPRRPGVVRAEELRSQPFVSQQSDVDADIQSYFKKNDLHVSSQCYIVDDQSMIAMVACGQGLALMPELMFKEGAASAGCQVLQLEPAAKRTIGLACLSRTALSPAAREFVEHARAFARKR